MAENPVRHGTLPVNIVDAAKVILDAGPSQSVKNQTLMLVSTGSVPRGCRAQFPLIDLLCDYGADPNRAVHAAALHGELEAVKAWMGRGARVDLPVAASLGHVEIVRLLLDAGEDPNRYNPVGAHAHATPLHQAAWGGHDEVVRFFVERGARLDMKDILWRGTPADWARHAGRTEIEHIFAARWGARSGTRGGSCIDFRRQGVDASG